MKTIRMNEGQTTITTADYEAAKQANRTAIESYLSKAADGYTAKTPHDKAVKASKATAYRTTKGRMKFTIDKAGGETFPMAFNALIFRANHDVETIAYNEVKCRKLTKGVKLTAEQQARMRESEIAAHYTGTTLPGLEGMESKSGKPWNYYSLARKACYGKLTEDMRAEHMDIFLLNYGDMLQSGIAALYDTERVAKTVARTLKKYPELEATPQALLLRAYFRTATNGIKNHIDSNKATFYRQAVNEAGALPTKDEAKDIRAARSSYYAENKYEATVESFDEETNTTVYAYHAPVEHYRQRVAIVNQDATYKASTSWNDTNAMINDGGDLELKMALLKLDLKQLLEDKPLDLEVAEKLLNGQISTQDWKKLSGQKRARIQSAFREALAL